MIRLYLVRHAETVWHAENRYTGRSDVALTPYGRAQAGALAEWARGAGLSAIWSSPLSRAIDTAAPAAAATKLAVRHDDRLREIDFGRAEGLTLAEIRQRFPAQVEAFQRDPAAAPLPGGEDPAAAALRATTCLREIAAAQPGGNVLVVAHSTLLRLALCSLLGLPLRHYRRIFPALHNVAITAIALEGAGPPALLMLNVPLSAGTLVG